MNADMILYNIMKDDTAVKPMNPQPRNELAKATRLVNYIMSILRGYYDAVDEVIFTYIFDEAEATRVGADAECNVYGGIGAGIGIARSIVFADDNYLKMVIIHELCHLRFMGHDKEFHEFLDELLNYYNSQTGEQLCNDYIPFAPIRNDGRCWH